MIPPRDNINIRDGTFTAAVFWLVSVDQKRHEDPQMHAKKYYVYMYRANVFSGILLWLGVDCSFSG